MNKKSFVVISSWIVVIFILLLITPASLFNWDGFVIIFFIIMIFAFGLALFVVIRSDNAQNMAEIEYEVTQLRYEIQILHEKIDEIKKSVEF